MKQLVDSLRKNLILAAYPHGGGEHLYPQLSIMGVDSLDLEKMQATRIVDKFETFESLKKKKEEEQTKKLKTISEKFDPPRRVEIKELELALKALMEFKDVDTKRKHKICREIAFIIKDMTLLYNMCNEGGPQIQMEFLGYRSEADEKKVFNPKPTTFTYFNNF